MVLEGTAQLILVPCQPWQPTAWMNELEDLTKAREVLEG